jgi:UDP-glucose 4-epimerase
VSGTANGPRSVAVLGANGYLGRQLIAALAADRRSLEKIVAVDVRETPPGDRRDGVDYVTADVRSPDLVDLLRKYAIETVIHLASIVTPGKNSDREFEYSVDVLGTRNVVESGLAARVTHLIVTSSGAAYGYHPDNPEWIDETDALRGNPEFAYSDHKRLVEEMLAGYRTTHPELRQLILRPGFILGATTRNQITALFDKKRVIGLRGASTPFAIIWDQDVVGVIIKGLFERAGGVYNLAGDGILTMREMAVLAGRRFMALPPGLVKAALWVLKKLGLTQYGPEQTMFLRYRPVLGNRRLKEEFGYVPRKTTREVFEYYLEGKRHGTTA